jgi:hypothetical protein
VYCFARELDGETLLVALNFTSGSVPLRAEEDFRQGDAEVILSTHPSRPLGQVDPRELVLEPDEGVILRYER